MLVLLRKGETVVMYIDYCLLEGKTPKNATLNLQTASEKATHS